MKKKCFKWLNLGADHASCLEQTCKTKRGSGRLESVCQWGLVSTFGHTVMEAEANYWLDLRRFLRGISSWRKPCYSKKMFAA